MFFLTTGKCTDGLVSWTQLVDPETTKIDYICKESIQICVLGAIKKKRRAMDTSSILLIWLIWLADHYLVSRSLSGIYSLLTTYYLLLTTYYWLLTTYYLLLTIYKILRVCQDVYEYARMYTSMPGCIRVCQNVYEYARMYQTVGRYTILYI